MAVGRGERGVTVVVGPVSCHDGPRPGVTRGLSSMRPWTLLEILPGGRLSRTAASVVMLSGPAAAFAALGVCLVAVVLVPTGLWRPALVLPLLVPVAAATWWLTGLVRRCLAPAAWRVPAWVAVASLAVSVGFAVWAGLTHGEHLVIRRDAGSYALYAQWLATRHGLPVDSGLAAFGGSAALGVPGFTLASPAYFQVEVPGGAEVVPQFLLGAPALFSMGWWAAGWTGLFTVSSLVGGLAILAAAGLTARIAGPRWAPVGALALALTQPVLHAARATLSEPLALLLVLAAASLAVDVVGGEAADGGESPATRRLALVAGAVLGLAGLVRIDVLREVALAMPVAAVLAFRGRRTGLALAGAALGGASLSAVPAWGLSRPYLEAVQASLRPLVVATLVLAAVSALALAATVVVRRGRAHRGDPGRQGTGTGPHRWSRALLDAVPSAVGVVVLLVGIGLVCRPAWMTVRQSASDSAVPLIASLQRQQGLPVDGARTYAERSVEWLVWYTGPAVAVLALVAVAVAAVSATSWAFGRGSDGDPGGAPAPAGRRPLAILFPLVVGVGSVVLTLYRPGITPDHPWADRRLVPVVLPFTVIAATAGAAWVTGELRRRTSSSLVAGAFAVFASAVLVVPAAVATWPLATSRTEIGQPSAASAVCGFLRPGDAVVAVSDSGGGIRAQNEWVQVVRGVCGRPSAALVSAAEGRPEALRRLSGLVEGAGGRLILLAAAEDDGSAARSLLDLGLSPHRAVRLRTSEDQHLLTRRPDALDSVMIDVWLAAWKEPGGR
ncbi:MAG: hypothetical protein QG622_3104 [Actinomycetota bacterium]|nr:hypothetical protein [Actinomycetota bacterium]